MSRYDWPSARRPVEERDDPAGRARWVEPRRADFDPEGAHAAVRRAHAPPEPRPGRGPFAPPTGRRHLWQPLGPMTVVDGQATGRPRVAGRVNALAVHHGGQRVYAAAANGGVWYTSDAGASWRSLGGFAPTNAAEVEHPAQRNALGAIQVAWGAAEADDLVYVGTGEVSHIPDAGPGSSLHGIGVLVARGPATSAAADPWTREAKELVGKGVARIALEPGGTGAVAATTAGLFERSAAAGAAPVADAAWARPAGSPFDRLKDRVADALWTAGDGARPARLWVWVREGGSAGLWVRAAGETDFTKVATPGAPVGVAVLAASTPPDRVWVFVDGGAGVLPDLWRVAAAGAGAPAATRVLDVPDVLGAQGFYDIAMAVHPATPDRIALGGSTFTTIAPDGHRLDDGAVVVGDVGMDAGNLRFGHPAAATMVGVGVHPDVQDLAWSDGGNRLWASCDGGVFRSDHPASMVGFVAVNDGLSVVESNYVACHPVCEGRVAAGLQDNGVIERRSTGVWWHEGNGDGGGIVFDPAVPTRYVRQHYGGFWSASAPGFATPFGADERKLDTAFYSMPAAVKHQVTVGGVAADVSQLLIGTKRPWYTHDFGASWFTLGSGTTPPAGDRAQDTFGQKITTCRWQGPHVAWVLGNGKLARYERTPGTETAAGPGTWAVETILQRRALEKKDPLEALRPLFAARVWTEVAVNLEPGATPADPPVLRGRHGAVYLGTIGKAGDATVDTLWWYDGNSTWHPTRLRSADGGNVPAPVIAVACDPAHPEEVWVGTTVGVWRGVRSFDGDGKPSWAWEPRLNGLPEAAVHDLSIYSHDGLRLLRAAIASRGLWELRLDTADVQDLTYLRAHDDDLRHRTSALVTGRDGKTARSWHGSPDVRPREAPRAMAVPASLSLTRAAPGDAARLRRFQAALRSSRNDPRVRATGEWDDYFNEVLRDLGAPILPSPPAAANTVHVDKAFWDAAVTGAHATAEPWGAGRPSEADLHDLVPRLEEGTLAQASCSIPRGKLKVDVVVHHRGLDPVDGADVRVTLLRWVDLKTKNAAKWDQVANWFAGDVPWTAAVDEVLDSADGKTAQAMTDGWRFVMGGAGESHRVTLAGQTLDATRSGIATFDLDTSAFRRNRVMLLVAVIRVAGMHGALAPATLERLALDSPAVAVRSMRIA